MRIDLVVIAFAFLWLPAVALAADGPPVPPGYEAAWWRIPEQHRAPVRSIVVEHRSAGHANRRSLTIRLPIGGRPGELYHEVGHVVAWARPDLDRAWQEQFWPVGQIRGIPATDYARTNPAEDWAESYQSIMEDGTLEDAERLTFMRERVFGQRWIAEPVPAVIAAPSPPRPIAEPCAGAGLPSGSIVPGCSTVPGGSVAP